MRELCPFEVGQRPSPCTFALENQSHVKKKATRLLRRRILHLGKRCQALQKLSILDHFLALFKGPFPKTYKFFVLYTCLRFRFLKKEHPLRVFSFLLVPFFWVLVFVHFYFVLELLLKI